MPSLPQQYKTASAFRRALEDRLVSTARNDGIALDRIRKRVAFDRILARLFNEPKPKWLLKGGYALEFRFQNIARATKDIDFSIPKMKEATAEKILELLGAESAQDLGDWFSFLIGAPMLELDRAVYGGWRFPVESRVDGRTFSKFHLDVGVGDALFSEPEWKSGPELLSFAGIPPARVALLPVDQQFSEKIHAYSLPRENPNSRVRDLVDLVLLIEYGLPDKAVMIGALKATFERRKTHELPTRLEKPPANWEGTYREMAEECGVTKKTIGEAFELLNAYWQKLFA